MLSYTHKELMFSPRSKPWYDKMKYPTEFSNKFSGSCSVPSQKIPGRGKIQVVLSGFSSRMVILVNVRQNERKCMHNDVYQLTGHIHFTIGSSCGSEFSWY
jgi:hypothetical protein